jgi:hypothetical protein
MTAAATIRFATKKQGKVEGTCQRSLRKEERVADGLSPNTHLDCVSSVREINRLTVAELP